jgi:hypothetical protein
MMDIIPCFYIFDLTPEQGHDLSKSCDTRVMVHLVIYNKRCKLDGCSHRARVRRFLVLKAPAFLHKHRCRLWKAGPEHAVVRSRAAAVPSGY